jgi:hypothetical protein
MKRILTLCLLTASSLAVCGCGQSAQPATDKTATTYSPDLWRGDKVDAAKTVRVAERLVAFRMTHQVLQKVAGDKYMDITGETYRQMLSSQVRRQDPVKASRIYFLWGPESQVLAVLEEVSRVLDSTSFVDLSDTLWIPDANADTIVLPAARAVKARDVRAAADEPIYWINLEITAQTHRGHYQKWISAGASVCVLKPGRAGWRPDAPTKAQLDRVHRALLAHLRDDESTVGVVAMRELPPAIPARLEGQAYKLRTPAGVFDCTAGEGEGDFLTPGLGRIQMVSRQKLAEEAELVSRTVIDELHVVE